MASLQSIQSLPFGSKKIGPGFPTVIIAEIGINHEGSVTACARLIEEAANAGADAIKLQTIDADTSYDRASPSYAIFKNSALTRDETAAMFGLARRLGMHPFTTAVDCETIDWVDLLLPWAHKVSSGLLTTTPILRHLARKARKLIVSTGMATEDEIDEAVGALRTEGASDVTLLHCTSVYPAPQENLNLSTISWLQEKWHLPVGFSDHSRGDEAAPIAVARGAVMIEKHFTLDANRPGFDHHLSLDPSSFKTMVEKIRRAEVMLGKPGRQMSGAELEVRRWAQRVLVAARDIDAGESIDSQNITFRRPALGAIGGLRPGLLDALSGRRATRKLFAGDILQEKDLQE